MEELYWITVTYNMPVSGTVQIFAKSADDAKDIVSKAHHQMKDFEIIHLHQLTDEQKKFVLANQAQGEFDFDQEIDKEKLN